MAMRIAAPTATATTAADAFKKNVLSVGHSLGDFGWLHASVLPDHALETLRAVCRQTTCDSIHHNAAQLFDQPTMQLLQQIGHGHETALLKLPDGYMMIVPALKNRVISVIKDSPLCLPSEAHPAQAPPIAPDGSRSVFYAIAAPPHVPESSVRGFHAVFHDGFTQAHEISRFSLADHAIAQLAAAIPLSQQRVIMQADNLGVFMGECLAGSDADLIKKTFLNLIGQTGGGCGLYDVPLETSQLIAELLQLRNRKGQISLGRCADGIFAYRRRRDNRNTFIFVASSDDFHAPAPSPVDRSILHVYKMSYADPSEQAPRIFVRIGGGFEGQGEHNIPSISSANTVQEIMNIVELAMRRYGRAHVGCAEFPLFCAQEALERVQANAPMSSLERQAVQSLFHPPPAAPNAEQEESPVNLLLSSTAP